MTSLSVFCEIRCLKMIFVKKVIFYHSSRHHAKIFVICCNCIVRSASSVWFSLIHCTGEGLHHVSSFRFFLPDDTDVRKYFFLSILHDTPQEFFFVIFLLYNKFSPQGCVWGVCHFLTFDLSFFILILKLYEIFPCVN